jgi:molybdopterin biosynthesis enzyme
MLSSLVRADGLALIPRGAEPLAGGTEVELLWLR